MPLEVTLDELRRRDHDGRCSRVDAPKVGSLGAYPTAQDIEGQQQVAQVIGLAPLVGGPRPDGVEVSEAGQQLRFVQGHDDGLRGSRGPITERPVGPREESAEEVIASDPGKVVLGRLRAHEAVVDHEVLAELVAVERPGRDEDGGPPAHRMPPLTGLVGARALGHERELEEVMEVERHAPRLLRDEEPHELVRGHEGIRVEDGTGDVRHVAHDGTLSPTIGRQPDSHVLVKGRSVQVRPTARH